MPKQKQQQHIIFHLIYESPAALYSYTLYYVIFYSPNEAELMTIV